MSEQTFIGVERGDGPTVTLETTGRVIRPLLQTVGRLVDECKLRIGPDGLSINTTGPANVGAVSVTAYPDAFATPNLPEEEMVVGLNLKRLRGRLRKARMGEDTTDDVTLEFDDAHTKSTILREYGDTRLTISDEFLNLDPNSIREEFDPPELELPWQATVDAQAFTQAVTSITNHYSHATLREDGGDLVLTGSEEENNSDKTVSGSEARFEGVATEGGGDSQGGEKSLFSQDYLEDVAYGIKKAKAERATLRWGEEFPLFASFSREQDGTDLYSGSYMLAPRIQSN